MSLDEHRIRELAYRIWESEGRPEGDHLRHWHQAREQMEAEAGGASPDTLDTASGGIESGVAPPMPKGPTRKAG